MAKSKGMKLSRFVQWLAFFAVIMLAWIVKIAILNKIWNITVVPLGAPHLTMNQMMGVYFFISAASYVYSESRGRSKDNEFSMRQSLERAASETLSLLITWGVVYLVF